MAEPRILDGLRVLALRHLAGATLPIDAAPGPGACQGGDPCLVRTGPTELLLLTMQDEVAGGVLDVLAPGREVLACAVDQSAATMAFEFLGADIDEVLPRLFDASAIPAQSGRGGRARMMDIAAVLVRPEAARMLLLVDRSLGPYAQAWIRHALGMPGGG